MVICQQSFYEDYIKTMNIYNSFDLTIFIIYQIMAIVGASVLSYQTSQMMCKLAVISLAPDLKLPEYKILTFLSLILLFLCPVVICIGHFLSASSQLHQYSLTLQFVNIFFPWIFFWFKIIIFHFLSMDFLLVKNNY